MGTFRNKKVIYHILDRATYSSFTMKGFATKEDLDIHEKRFLTYNLRLFFAQSWKIWVIFCEARLIQGISVV